MKVLSLAFLVTWLAAGIRLAGPVLLAALGETFAERSGIINLGIEGILLLGALASYLTSISFGSPWLSLFAAMLTGFAASLFLAWMYVTVRASQVVVGLVGAPRSAEGEIELDQTGLQRTVRINGAIVNLDEIVRCTLHVPEVAGSPL